jgi:hypothetical protein
MKDSQNPDETPGWFDRKENIQKVLVGLYIGCGALVLIDVIFRIAGVDKHPHFKWEQWPGFYAVYGFVACVLLVLVSKYVLRPLVMKDEDYYKEKNTEQDREGGPDDV